MANILFLSHRLPFPPDKGDKIRSWNMLQHLASLHSVRLGCLIDDPADRDHLPALRPICAEIAAFETSPRQQKLRAMRGLRPGRPLTLDYFHDPRLADWVDATLAEKQVDCLFVFSSGMAAYGMRGAECRRILDMVDVDSDKWSSYARGANPPMNVVWAREGRTLLAFERLAAVTFDHTLLVSEAERSRFTTMAPETEGRTLTVENGVDLERFRPGLGLEAPFAPASASVVFTGRMDYWPNEDAAVWFATEVMPKLRQRHPEASFHIVGASPGPAVRRLARDPAIHITGRVPDVRPYMAHAAVVVAPLRIARGIQNKVLEAMAMGRTVLASPEAFEGVRATAGRDLLVAHGAEEFARVVGEVLDGRHGELGLAARRAVEAAYDWRHTLAPLDTLIAETGQKLGAAA